MLAGITRRLVLAAAIGCAATLLGATPAFADSSTIAGEPTVVPDQEQFGNNADNQSFGDSIFACWGLPTIAGDHVTINWAGDATEQSGGFELDVEPVGTLDGLTSLGFVERAQTTQELSTRLNGSLRFTAPRSGTMPLVFVGFIHDTGPYTFTAYVLHRVDLQLPGVHRVARTGHLRIEAHNPDGGALTVPGMRVALQYQVTRRRWVTVGRAAPRHGIADVGYTLPADLAGQAVRLRARGSGGGYFPISTVSRGVRVG